MITMGQLEVIVIIQRSNFHLGFGDATGYVVKNALEPALTRFQRKHFPC